MSEKKFSELKRLLDDQHQWPCLYTFKFIVPANQYEELKSILPQGKTEERTSKSGKYISVTIISHMKCSAEVIKVYQTASRIENLVCL